MTTTAPEITPKSAARKGWMSLLAKARPAELAALMRDVPAPGFVWLRPPQIGGVMLRGRMGGTGAPFNLGEMTVTRCALKLDSGEVGHAYVQGRDKTHAERAAVVDALMQTDRAEVIREAVLAPLDEAATTRAGARAAKAAATKVDFFTMVRGED
ncbi:phosphonate C-P lyase system protein PhnG [Maritimibacter sp. UBA3975]|uniref:phosphonate C-P lyase system protein PhnG n=1 Tax=Maritimibacter sp. UBA3975 TaxID=1946833 RepID=UPI000C0A11D3|nr:phosphonate C-P lyase system protein PhnG [Maritimibacter sp. UBA3975]MAM63165.1 phosphonate C-P lyase system protein PhnG [Maritimibacter sp.]|tara:strand:+ start:36937 stop:37401 length:465 start_codon:yes stop_codon:yes gene_type:complete